MKLKWDRWLYGLGSAAIGGGAGAVVSGLTNMGIAPETFNLTTGAGALKLLLSVGINFGLVGTLSMFFYLKQSPLPEASNDTTFTKNPNPPPKE